MKKITKRSVFLLLPVLLLLGVTAFAQSPTIDNLVVQIWPEFDRPETLIIYQGQLAADESLPATLTFELPARIEKMHAVAIMAPEGNLVNADYTLTPKDDSTLVLTFTADNPRFQFEYYDPAVVVKNGSARNLAYVGTTLSPVNSLQIEVQQPVGAKDMEITPPADEVMTGSNNFQYFIYKRENVEPGQFINLTGKYTKESDTLTVDAQTVGIVQPTAAPASPPLAAAMPGGSNWAMTLGYVLVGLGVGVLLVAVGIWFFNNRGEPEPEEVSPRRPVRKRGTPPAPKAVNPAGTTDAKSKFCPQCGTRYKPGAKFCHQCGAPRR